MVCGLDDDDIPEDPIIVPVKTRIPIHRLPDSYVSLCINVRICIYVELCKWWLEKASKLGFV